MASVQSRRLDIIVEKEKWPEMTDKNHKEW